MIKETRGVSDVAVAPGSTQPRVHCKFRDSKVLWISVSGTMANKVVLSNVEILVRVTYHKTPAPLRFRAMKPVVKMLRKRTPSTHNIELTTLQQLTYPRVYLLRSSLPHCRAHPRLIPTVDAQTPPPFVASTQAHKPTPSPVITTPLKRTTSTKPAAHP